MSDSYWFPQIATHATALLTTQPVIAPGCLKIGIGLFANAAHCAMPTTQYPAPSIEHCLNFSDALSSQTGSVSFSIKHAASPFASKNINGFALA